MVITTVSSAESWSIKLPRSRWRCNALSRISRIWKHGKCSQPANSQRVWLGLACFLGGSCDELPLVLGRLLLFRPPPELERVPAYPQGARVHAHPAGRPVPGIQSAMETRGLLRQLCVCIAPWRRLDQGLSGIIMNKYKRVCSTTSKPDTSCDDVRYRWPSKCIQDTSKAARARGKATARHRSGEMRWESGA